MKGTCKKSDCAIAHDLPCELGNPRPTDCAHFQPAAMDVADPAREVVTDDPVGLRLPWTGRGLGVNDIGLASARSPADLVGVIGPHNAGKTALLTAMFAHFSRTGLIGEHSFAGSFTLQAWLRLKQYTAWPAASGPMFPPHTPDSGERVPSMLHLAFRRGHGLIRDLLFTDAPGEWFTRWERNQAAEEARGARWVADHSSRFLFVIDREGLAGADVGLVRQNTLSLARLLSEQRRGRPVAAVWTKSDIQCDEVIEAPIRTRLNELFGPHPSFNVAVSDEACLRVLATLLNDPLSVSPLKPHRIVGTTSAFLAYDGERS